MKNTRKKQKIKTYDPFVDKRAKRRKLLRALLLLVFLGLLFFGGWLVARWYLERPERPPETSVSTPLPESSEVGGPGESSLVGEEGGEAPGLPQTQQAAGLWAELSYDELGTAEALSAAVGRLVEQGATHALVWLKDEDGLVYWPTQQPAGQESIADGGFDAAEVAQALRSAGITPVAGLTAYRDPIAPRTARAAAVMLRTNPEYLWLDAAQASGGQPWLNAYSEAAEGYIEGLVTEAIGLGYEVVAVSDLRFPDGHGLDQALLEGGLGYNGRLAATAKRLAQTAEAAGGSCWFVVGEGAVAVEGESVTGAPLEWETPLVITISAARMAATDPYDTLPALQQALEQRGGVQVCIQLAGEDDGAWLEAARKLGFLSVLS